MTAPVADAVFYARLLPRGRAARASSCARPATRACSCPVTARRTRRSSRPRVPQAANGAILSAPPAPAPADFNAEVQGRQRQGRRVCTRPRLRRDEHLPGRHRGRQDQPRGHERRSSAAYTGDGVSGPIEFDDKGDITRDDDLRLQGRGRQARHRQPDADQVVPRHVGPSQRLRPGVTSRPQPLSEPGRRDRRGLRVPVQQLRRADHHRSRARRRSTRWSPSGTRWCTASSS